MAESVSVLWDWQPAGQVALTGALLVFPHVPNMPGVYRLTLSGADGSCTGVYVGETDQLPRRFRRYRTPGTDQRLTMFRVNKVLSRTLAEGGPDRR